MKKETWFKKVDGEWKEIEMINMGNLINLESVGTGLDKDGMTYPMLESGGYDYGSGIHLDDIEPDGDWMLALSEADKIRISWVSRR